MARTFHHGNKAKERHFGVVYQNVTWLVTFSGQSETNTTMRYGGSPKQAGPTNATDRLG
jgi:hypothetical protein